MSRSPKAAVKRLQAAQARLRAVVDAPCLSIRRVRDGAALPAYDNTLAVFAKPAKPPHVCGPRCLVIEVHLAGHVETGDVAC